MSDIPASISQVTVEFASSVKRDVTETMIQGLKHCIRTDIAPDQELTKIFIMSARDKHTSPSRHVTGQAVDISRINGKKISIHYETDESVRAIVDAIQDEFESFGQRRENFGPHIKRKNGNEFPIAGHADHIHLSVN